MEPRERSRQPFAGYERRVADRPQPPLLPALLLGIGFGGFVDGIILLTGVLAAEIGARVREKLVCP